MKANTKSMVLTTLLIGSLSGCSALVSDSMLRAAHQDMDKNHDGYIDYHEYTKSGKINMKDVKSEAKKKGMSVEEYQRWDFGRADFNGDGKVTPQELIDLARKEL